MDFQSRVNSFRQGLKDQQDSYNSLAQTASQYGRSVIPDKVAKHFQFMEQTGGMITGASAGLHGAVGLGKKIMKYRRDKIAKNNPTGNNKGQQQKEQTSKLEDESATKGQGAKPAGQDDSTAQGANPVKDPSASGEVGAQENLQKKGRRANEDDDDGDAGGGGGGGGAADSKPIPKGKGKLQTQGDEEPQFDERDFGGSDEDALTASLRGQGGTDLFQQASTRGLGAGDSATRVEQQTPPASQSTAKSSGGSADDDTEGGGTSEFSKAPLEDKGTLDTFKPQPAEVDADSGGIIDTIKGAAQKAGKFAGDAADAAGAAKDYVGGVLKSGAEKIVGEVGAEGLAEAVPIFGELFGLGMLIHGLIKAHKHEENAPPPQLTAANAEATQQSGGFSSTMLKGQSVAPTIV